MVSSVHGLGTEGYGLGQSLLYLNDRLFIQVADPGYLDLRSQLTFYLLLNRRRHHLRCDPISRTPPFVPLVFPLDQPLIIPQIRGLLTCPSIWGSYLP